MYEPDNRPTVLDLFSGIGGFSLAFESEGFRTIGFAEIDPYASAVLKKHWPDVPNYGDVRKVPAVECDVLTGGFPCQPFSVAGKRRGAKDDRALWPAMLAVIERCRPAFILGENVPGIVNMELDTVLSDLEGKGYAARPFIIPAIAVDARHRRDRVWIVAESRHSRLHQRRQFANAERESVEPGGVVGNVLPQRNGTKGKALAYTNEAGRREQRGAEPIQPEYPPPQRSCQIMANTKSKQARGIQQRRIRAHIGAGSNGAGGAATWPTEPAVGRVVDGIPNRSHRLKCLGNSIVPQVAQIFARAIKETLTHD